MGEGLPYALWRMDSRWAWHNHRGIELDLGNPSEYVRRNMYITTSGVDSVPPLLRALLAIGAEHILFATDYPFEEISLATEFLAHRPDQRGGPREDLARERREAAASQPVIRGRSPGDQLADAGQEQDPGFQIFLARRALWD